MQQWACIEVESNKYSYTFNGERNLIMCSYSRFEEFTRLASELYFLRNYDVVAYQFMGHNNLILVDSESIIASYTILDES